MAGQRFEASRHVLVLALTVLVFLSGIALGYLLNRQQVSVLETEISSLSDTMQDVELQSLLAEVIGPARTCPFLTGRIDSLGDQLDEVAGRLTDYEKSRKFGESFMSLKERYTTLLVRDWLFARKASVSCNSTSVKTVLYFYTNKDCPDCTSQGVVLDVEKRKMGQALLVFPLDTDLNMQIVQALEESYNVTRYPSLVVGDTPLAGGFVSKEALETSLGNA